MDTSDFIVKRQQIQERMDLRRSQTAESIQHGGAWKLALTAGVGLLSTFGGSRVAGRWARSLLWAVAVPALAKFFRKKNDSFLHRLTSSLVARFS